jgi:hypothetical protein
MGRAVRPTGTGGIRLADGGLRAPRSRRGSPADVGGRRGIQRGFHRLLEALEVARLVGRPGERPGLPGDAPTARCWSQAVRTRQGEASSAPARTASERGEPRERGAPVMRRRGFEPPPTKCGPGPHFVTRLSDPFHASRTSDASADLDRLDVIDDLDVAADVATAAALAAKATLDSPVAAPLLCMDRNSPPVTAAFHGCRSGTASDRAPEDDRVSYEGLRRAAPAGTAHAVTD